MLALQACTPPVNKNLSAVSTNNQQTPLFVPRNTQPQTLTEIQKKVQKLYPGAMIGTQNPLFQGYLNSQKKIAQGLSFKTQIYWGWRDYTGQMLDQCAGQIDTLNDDPETGQRIYVSFSNIYEASPYWCSDTDQYLYEDPDSWATVNSCNSGSDYSAYPIYNVTARCSLQNDNTCTRVHYRAGLIKCCTAENNYCDPGSGDNGGGDDDNGSCPEGTPAIFDPVTQTLICGASCPPGTVPTASGSGDGTEVCEPVDDEPCEDAQALFPSQLNTPVNAAQNLVQPIIDPAPMNQDLGDWQKLLKKLKDRQAKMAAEQAKPNPNPNRLNNLQAEANATQAQIDVVTPRIQSRVSQMDSARPTLRSALNSVAQAPDFSQDAHADQQVNPLPQTLEEYRTAIQFLLDDFEISIITDDTQSVLNAASVLADEQELFGHLVRDTLAEKFPFTPEEPDDNPTDEDLENLNTPRKVIRFFARKLANHSNQLKQKQDKLNASLAAATQEIPALLTETRDLIQEAFLMQLIGDGVLNPETLEITLPSDFQIQQTSPFIPPQMIPPLAKDATARIVQGYNSLSNWMHAQQDPIFAYFLQKSVNQTFGRNTWENLTPEQKRDSIEGLRTITSFSGVPTDPEDIAFLLMGLKALDSASDAKKIATLVGKNADLAVTVLKAVKNNFKGQLTPELQFQLNSLINKISHLKNNKKALEAFADRIIRECTSPSILCGRISKNLLIRLKGLFNGPGGERFIHELVSKNNLGYAGKNLKFGSDLGDKLLSTKKYNIANTTTNGFKSKTFKPESFASADAQQRLKKLQSETQARISRFLNEGIDLKTGTGFPDFAKYELTSVDFTHSTRADKRFLTGSNTGPDMSEADGLALAQLKTAGLLPQNAVKTDVEKLRSKLALTWHHDEDMKTMRLIPTAIHASTNHHLGGASVSGFIKRGDISKESYNNFIGKQIPDYYRKDVQ